MLVSNRTPKTVNHDENHQKQSNVHLANTGIVLGRPRIQDAAHVHALIDTCKPLDLNSTYAYLLLCHHHADTCVVARRNEQLIGFISGYLLPQDPKTLFIWQVAVHPSARGAGLGTHMLSDLIKRDAAATARFMETTVSPSNEASRRMFQHFADEIGTPINEEYLFGRDMFGIEDHEEEVLLKIGPFDPTRYGKDVQ